ncbi:MFS transporter [Nocardia miyunensis]|uniref:MFS transporter n=1 Tax=Nocardia miyunensis TaxID=282684 RepID=UPI000835B7C8|nr:MFS transporter [Nocardia miyunensis]
MSHPQETVKPRQTPGKAALASFLGSLVEYYDFFIYGSASALVFGHVFFPKASATAGTLAALATFAVAYVARPVGSFFLGHFGDRIGRKRVLITTLALMGGSTFAIGCVPGYASIGVAAPILLVLLRILQGLSAAGEQSGASSMTLEHSPEGRRAYFTSFTLSGTQAGLVVATLVFIPVAALPESALYSWGWRIPFWASAIAVFLAMVVRRSLHEPPTFEQLKQEREIVKFPLGVFIRHYWRSFLRIVLCHLYGTISTAVTVFGLSYAVSQWHITRSSMLWTIVLANIVQVATIPAWAKLSDRIGRRPVFAAGAVGCAVSVFAYFAAITSGNWLLVAAASVLLSSVCYAGPNAVWPAMYAEMFDARVRYTGLAVSTQFANLALGFLPAIAAILIGTGTFGWVPIAVLLATACLIAAAAAFAGGETAHIPLRDLGHVSRVTTTPVRAEAAPSAS